MSTPAPVVAATASATVTGVRATSTGQAHAPTVATDANITTPAAAATAQAYAPAATAGALVEAVTATAAAETPPPVVVGTINTVAAATTATATALAHPPVVDVIPFHGDLREITATIIDNHGFATITPNDAKAVSRDDVHRDLEPDLELALGHARTSHRPDARRIGTHHRPARFRHRVRP